MIAPNNILTALFPHDLGLDSPNVANHYQLQSVGLVDFATYIPELGIPYIWAQRIAGLDFMGARAIEMMGSDNQVFILLYTADTGCLWEKESS